VMRLLGARRHDATRYWLCQQSWFLLAKRLSMLVSCWWYFGIMTAPVIYANW
jgi:hypothetical protein